MVETIQSRLEFHILTPKHYGCRFGTLNSSLQRVSRHTD